MARFRIPGPLRRLSNGEITVEVGGADLGSAIVALDERYPGFRDRLLDEKGDLRQFVNVYLNDEDVRLGSGLSEKVAEGDEISIIPAVAGGCPDPSPPCGEDRRGWPACHKLRLAWHAGDSSSYSGSPWSPSP